ncbi:hypothetical protein MG293_000858 [Ovis ammon polii]|uniref:Uncharacterized protein n=1 Tax=Ovis ammon polii TaxID=230172 RepID=A0AAD4ULI9_OVIAM|nr:hypothetical protein MG293_000858 [Ovis ammon polii]
MTTDIYRFKLLIFKCNFYASGDKYYSLDENNPLISFSHNCFQNYGFDSHIKRPRTMMSNSPRLIGWFWYEMQAWKQSQEFRVYWYNLFVLYPDFLIRKYSLLRIPGGSAVKNLPTKEETRVQFLGQEDPLEKEMATHSIVPGKFHGQRSLVGYRPWGRKESDMTKIPPGTPLLHSLLPIHEYDSISGPKSLPMEGDKDFQGKSFGDFTDVEDITANYNFPIRLIPEYCI